MRSPARRRARGRGRPGGAPRRSSRGGRRPPGRCARGRLRVSCCLLELGDGGASAATDGVAAAGSSVAGALIALVGAWSGHMGRGHLWARGRPAHGWAGVARGPSGRCARIESLRRGRSGYMEHRRAVARASIGHPRRPAAGDRSACARCTSCSRRDAGRSGPHRRAVRPWRRRPRARRPSPP